MGALLSRVPNGEREKFKTTLKQKYSWMIGIDLGLQSKVSGIREVLMVNNIWVQCWFFFIMVKFPEKVTEKVTEK